MVEILAPAIPLIPWLAAVVIVILRLTGRTETASPGNPAIVVTYGANLLTLLILLILDLRALLGGAPGQVRVGQWLESGPYALPVSFTLDPLGLTMGTLFALVLLLTVRFSINYMHREGGFQRYFMVINLFAGAMLLIVTAGNAGLAFAGWEVAGVSSFLLIGYAIDRPVAVANANRAFITNRFGDAGFIFALYLTFAWIGSVEWDRIAALADKPSPLGVSLIAAGFLIAALAKSAQIPFSPWISRALDGPTPSSAVFYGSLMAHAGVYLMLRLESLLAHAPEVMGFIAAIGLLTALYGWLSGLAQSDVKSSLIFSSTAMIGLMFFACGMGWFTAAAWGLGLHASWRIYQFLHAPALMFLIDRGTRPAPAWLARRPGLFTAALQRFWLEHMGEALITQPTAKLAADAQAFESRIVTPLMGLPAQASAISSLAQWEERKAGTAELQPEGGVARGVGVAGKLIEGMANVLHWFESKMVLQGGGEGLINTLERLGNGLVRIDRLLAEPRYLLTIVLITLVAIL